MITLKKRLFIFILLILVAGGTGYYLYQSLLPTPPSISPEDRTQIALMPLPSKLNLKQGKFVIGDGLQVVFEPNPPTRRLENAFSHLIERITQEERDNQGEASSPQIIIRWGKKQLYPWTPEEEEYQVEIDSKQVLLTARTELGAMRGLATLAQLAVQGERRSYFPACTIKDTPRYSWRGLMIDASRHWMPKEVILRNLDGMAAVKMNVLHLHLTDDQGFRVESKQFPRLHEMGSNGNYYSQDDIREMVEYAADRGIRIVPEFDVPGHTTSWLVGYPELGSGSGPYALVKTFGGKTSALDPSKEEVYGFLDELIGEMAALFPDPYFHIGGDEVNPQSWESNAEIQQFIQEKQLEDHYGLQAYFNQRLQMILDKHGKTMLAWEEILHPDLPKDAIMVQSWRTHKSLIEAAHAGYDAILSNGWYLDHKLPAKIYYARNPEVVRGGVNIEPDSIWASYALEMTIQGKVIPSTLTLFGEGEQLRGVWEIMDNMAGFETASLENGQLTFEVEGPMGTIVFEGTVAEEKISGNINLAFLDFEISGQKSGAHDLPGSFPPKMEKIPTLTEESRARILGGEACMWSELVSDETIDSRIWPATAAIAEKLWSPQVLTEEVEDMYRRLYILTTRLTELGLEHQTYRRSLLERIAPNSPDLAALETLVDVLEESKYYERLGTMMDKPLDTPLEFLADAAAPESWTAREFANQVDIFLADSTHNVHQKSILRNLRLWEANHRPFLSTIQQNPDLAPYVQLSKYLSVISNIGTKAVHAIANETSLPKEEHNYYQEMLDIADESILGVELAVVEAIRRLIDEAVKRREKT